MGTVSDKINYLNGTKNAIKNAIIAKGVSVNNSDTFRSYATKIGQIPLKTLGSKTITANGTYDPLDDSLDGYNEVVVSVSGGGGSTVNITGSSAIITAELPNTTIKLYDSNSTLLDTKTTDTTVGGYVVFDINVSGTYTIKAYDNSETLLWTNTVTVTDIGLYNCKVGKAFADYTPAEVNTASKNHYARYMWSVGDSRNITTVGSSKKWVILGFEHDNLANSSGKAGITLGMQRYTNSSYRNNSANDNTIGWEGSLIRQNGLKSGDVYYTITTVTADTSGTYYTYDEATDAWVQRTLPNDYLADEKYYTQNTMDSDGAFITGLPDWKDYIVPIVKDTADAGVYIKIIKSKDYIFSLSDGEVFGNSNRYSRYSQYELEGNQYDYFKNDFQDAKVRLGAFCWLRSPYSGNSTSFCGIHNSGCINDTFASHTYPARLGFCL